jgi:hypothetical protein
LPVVLWAKAQNIFFQLAFSDNLTGKGLVTTKGFKGSFADAASSAKVMIHITHVHFAADVSLFTAHAIILSFALDICCSCWCSKFGCLHFETTTWER